MKAKPTPAPTPPASPRQRPVVVESPDGASLDRNATLTGVVRTTKGYAAMIVVVDPSGALVSAKLHGSQAYPDWVVRDQARMSHSVALAAQVGK